MISNKLLVMRSPEKIKSLQLKVYQFIACNEDIGGFRSSRQVFGKLFLGPFF